MYDEQGEEIYHSYLEQDKPSKRPDYLHYLRDKLDLIDVLVIGVLLASIVLLALAMYHVAMPREEPLTIARTWLARLEDRARSGS